MLEDVGRKFDRRVVIACQLQRQPRHSRVLEEFQRSPVAAKWAMATPAHALNLSIRHWQFLWLRIAPQNKRVICDDGISKLFRNVVFLVIISTHKSM